MNRLITIGGSSSKNSINKQLAEYVGGLVSKVDVINLDLNNYQMPLFSIDIETEKGFTNEVKKLNKVIESADAFILSLAEHNGAYSAAFKNAFDWLSRIEGKVWRDKPMLLMATSPGARGGSTVLEIANGRFPYNGGNIIGSLSVPSFYDNFKDGEITNLELKTKIELMVKKLEKNL